MRENESLGIVPRREVRAEYRGAALPAGRAMQHGRGLLSGMPRRLLEKCVEALQETVSRALHPKAGTNEPVC